jgi:DNA-binding response OmpR family regulator
VSPKLIILVEDDHNLRHSIALILKHAGYKVTVTDSACAAMDCLRLGEHQLVISDNNMPDARQVLIPGVLDNYPDLSLLILTDLTLPDIEKDEIPAHLQYLVKPVAPEHLLACVATFFNNLGEPEYNDKDTKYINQNTVYR